MGIKVLSRSVLEVLSKRFREFTLSIIGTEAVVEFFTLLNTTKAHVISARIPLSLLTFVNLSKSIYPRLQGVIYCFLDLREKYIRWSRGHLGIELTIHPDKTSNVKYYIRSKEYSSYSADLDIYWSFLDSTTLYILFIFMILSLVLSTTTILLRDSKNIGILLIGGFMPYILTSTTISIQLTPHLIPYEYSSLFLWLEVCLIVLFPYFIVCTTITVERRAIMGLSISVIAFILCIFLPIFGTEIHVRALMLQYLQFFISFFLCLAIIELSLIHI